MTDYVNTFGAATKDANNEIITAADIGAELDTLATAVATKADKAVPLAIGNIALLTSSGNLSDGGQGVPSGTIVGTTDTQTLTNKTLTSPAITDPTITAGGLTISSTEIGCLDGVSSNIQTQINGVSDTAKWIITSDTSDMALPLITSSYTAFGSPFSLDIPTTGVISGFMTGRFRTDANVTSSLYIGIRIGITNYWLGSGTRVSGGISFPSYGYAMTTGATLNDYLQTSGQSTPNFGATLVSSSVDALSVPTGTQTVQLIVASSTGTATLVGATTTSRFHLKVEGTR